MARRTDPSRAQISQVVTPIADFHEPRGRRAPRLRKASALLAAGTGLLLLTGASAPNAKEASPEKPPAPKSEKPAESSRRSPAAIRMEALPSAFRKSSPSGLEDLKAMEKHVRTLVSRVSPAVVAVQLGQTTGSGVVISSDGLVLTAAHVAEEPGKNVTFTFSDGRTARGKTLGTNHEMDAGMMRITDAGTWPHVSADGISGTKPGDWVLAVGHPGGYDPERSLVVRLGRVLRVGSDMIQTDCTITAGDSGGPLFDMRGNVIGIHSRISSGAEDNYHVPIQAYRESWERLASSENWGRERPVRPWFGVRGEDHPGGCILDFVQEDSPAFKAGLKAGDVVRKVNGKAIDAFESLRLAVARSQPDDELKLELQREEKELQITVKIGRR